MSRRNCLGIKCNECLEKEWKDFFGDMKIICWGQGEEKIVGSKWQHDEEKIKLTVPWRIRL